MSPVAPTAAVEQRIQRLEDSATDFTAHAAAEEFRFEMISNQIKDLGERMEKAVGDLGEAVRDIREQQIAQGRKLDNVESSVSGLLKHEEDFQRVKVLYGEHEKRLKLRKRMVTVGTIVGTAVLVQFGYSIWHWFTKLF